MARFLDIFEFLSVLLRALSYAALALTVGGVIFLLAVIVDSGGPSWQAVRRWSARAAALFATVELARVVLTSLILQATLGLTLASLIGADYFVWGALTVIAGIATVSLLYRFPYKSVPLLTVAVLLLTAAAMTSHAAARVNGRGWLAALTVVHAAGVAAWVGGLPFLLIATRTAGMGSACVARRFSRIAVVSVATLAVSGLVLGWVYIGKPSGLYGTAYGYMVCTKVILFGFALILGAFNKRIVARLSGGTAPLLSRLRCFTETEIGIGFTVVLAAASLTSQPPAVDLQTGRLTIAEIADRFHPRFPNLQSPPVKALSPASPLPGSLASKPVVSQLPAASLAAGNDADIAWSEYNHHWAGIVVGLAGLLALLYRTGRAPWAAHWPLVFLGLALFILLRADPENWPLGPRSFWGSFLVPEVLQHRFFAVLVSILAITEWRIRTARNPAGSSALVFPLLCAVGGALLLTHNHSLANIKEELFAEMSHTPIAIAALVAGGSRWLELRLPGKHGAFGWVWPVALLSIGVMLILYREH